MRLRGSLLIILLNVCALIVRGEEYPSETTTLTPCIGAQQILTATQSGDAYRWTKDGQLLPDDSRSVIVQADAPAVYVCQVLEKTVSAKFNLMANGDFEANPPISFSSDYTYAGWDPSQYYSNHGGASNLYAITHDASYFWKDFYRVLPHGGKWFSLFDAGTKGYAWKAETKDNTDLVLEKDSTYLFSYWAAYPNKDPNKSPARLQFVIVCKDASGRSQTYNLGTEHTLGKASPLNAWELIETTWKSPVSSNEVLIGVYDNNTSSSGNDFCLDDIMFQKTTTIDNIVVYENVFVIKPHDCNLPCPTPFEDVQDTVVCDTLLPYQWQGYTFTKPDRVEWIEQSPRGCDSILHVLVLDTVRCLPDPPPSPVCKEDMVYAKWTDVLFCSNADDAYIAWQWYCDGRPLEGETKQFLYFPDTGGKATAASVFHVCARMRSGEEQCSCALPYAAIPRSADTYADASPARLVSRGGTLVLTLSDAAYTALALFCPDGRLVTAVPVKEGENVLSNLPKGFYLVRLTGAERTQWIVRIIVK